MRLGSFIPFLSFCGAVQQLFRRSSDAFHGGLLALKAWVGPLGYSIFPLIVLIGDPIYQYFFKGFKGPTQRPTP